MTSRKNSVDEPLMLNDINPNRGFNRQTSLKDESPKFASRNLNNQSTLLPQSKSGTLSVFEQNRRPFGAESLAFTSSNLKNFSIMNVSYFWFCTAWKFSFDDR